MVWLDVEGQQYWTPDCNQNLRFFEQLVGYLSARLGAGRVGVYASPTSWKSLMCDQYTPFSAALPLWYPHYDKKANFTDFNAYGGWTKPKIKQYVGSASVCGAGVDLSVKWSDAGLV